RRASALRGSCRARPAPLLRRLASSVVNRSEMKNRRRDRLAQVASLLRCARPVARSASGWHRPQTRRLEPGEPGFEVLAEGGGLLEGQEMAAAGQDRVVRVANGAGEADRVFP